jgi:hypothetical protein
MVLAAALASGLIVTTASVTVNTAIRWQLPYTCHPVQIKAEPIAGTSRLGVGEKSCSFIMQPWWVDTSGIAGLLAGGIAGFSAVERRRRDHGGLMRARLPVLVE